MNAALLKVHRQWPPRMWPIEIPNSTRLTTRYTSFIIQPPTMPQSRCHQLNMIQVHHTLLHELDLCSRFLVDGGWLADMNLTASRIYGLSLLIGGEPIKIIPLSTLFILIRLRAFLTDFRPFSASQHPISTHFYFYL